MHISLRRLLSPSTLLVSLALPGCAFIDQATLDARLDLDGDGVPYPSDCAPDDASVYPGAPESCDGVDQDCDGEVDNDPVDAVAWYVDGDDDGYGDGAAVTACDAPEGRVADATDCNDGDGAIHPGAAEVCDGVDQDCDSVADNDPTDAPIWYADLDGDGFGDADQTVVACENPDDASLYGDDCDDADEFVYPGALETCDGIDQDCDGATDNDATDALTWYADIDGDGHGDADVPVYACEQPADAVELDDDCDDADAEYHPGAAETDCADPKDYNCDGSVGTDDADNDGVIACEDCDDTDGARYPAAVETCDGVDQDCDGAVDDSAADAGQWYQDTDGDGYGTGVAVSACSAPIGYVAITGDCDDAHADALPGGVEFCDGLDNDCDGTVDVGASDETIWYQDSDLDGFGDDAFAVGACEAPTGYVSNATDCDDGAAAVYPGAPEVCDDVDNACNGSADDLIGLWFADVDGDGFGDPGDVSIDCAAPAGYIADDTDCDDADEAINPIADEICDGIDDNCDGVADTDAVDVTAWYLDADGDGFGDSGFEVDACDAPVDYVSESGDCDDGSPAYHPGAEELDCTDPNDYNCDGSVAAADADGDGYAACEDCDDGEASVNPAQVEVCGGVDENCDGAVDEASAFDAAEWFTDTDGDGFGDVGNAVFGCVAPVGAVPDGTDCDDGDLGDYPGAAEVVGNGDDEDCDGGEICYEDGDDDGYLGAAGGTRISADADCTDAYEGTNADLATDCDDAEAGVNPGVSEVCDDGVDDDCDGAVDAADGDCAPSADYVTTWGSEMILIPAGTFTMGGGAGDPDGSYTDHEVTLTHDFWIGQTEITRAQWEAWSGGSGWAYHTTYPCTGTTADCPTNLVSWYDSAEYANALSAAEGLTPCYVSDGTDLAAAYLADPYSCPGYRLPTEAEWEYAARAGEETTYSGSNTAADVAWTYETAYSLGTYSHEVAMLVANAWGLYDMSGNQREWANDCYSSSYGGYGTGLASTDPAGPTSGSTRVVRGGGFDDYAVDWATVSSRVANSQIDRSFSSLRLARTSFTTTNFAPTTPIAAIAPTAPVDSDDLLCAGSDSIDPDGDTVAYLYSWTVDGVSAGIVADTVPAASTSAGEVWECSVTASDGVATSAAATASVGIPADVATDYATVWGSEMILLPAGTYSMGSGAADPDGSYTDHDVTLTHDFWIGQTELTQAQWALFSGAYDTTPSSHSGCADCPVEEVSWYDSALYANALSTAEGLAPCYLADGTDLAAVYLSDPYSCPGYRMPTEAEWEYAARAGEDTTYSGSNTVGDVAWYDANSGSSTHDSCTLASNAWGLCDMSGNVNEWTNDWYDASYGGYGTGTADEDPPGPLSGSSRVVSGGSIAYGAVEQRVAYRRGDTPNSRANTFGVRLVRSSFNITNFAPTTPIAALTPTTPTDSDDIACTGSGSVDPDGDTVVYTYSWTVDGVDAGISTDTVPAASTTIGEIWACNVIATDGFATSAAATASVNIAADPADYTTVWGSDMILITAGTFSMGSGRGDPDGSYVDHDVTLTRDFWIGQTELTQAQWAFFTGAYDTTPSYFSGCADCPVEQVSWYDAAQYANALSVEEGLMPCYLADGTDLAAAYLADPYSCPGYRMPTESEWEYSARAGEDTTYSGSNSVWDVAWFSWNSGSTTHDACTLAANAWGLCDMSGNVYEWTNDTYSGSYDGYGTGSASTDPPGPSYSGSRVLRGGEWDVQESMVRVGFRNSNSPSGRNRDWGVRLCRTVP